MSKPKVKSLKDFGGSAKKLLRYADQRDRKWSAFNPSIAMNPDGKIGMVLRSSNYILGQTHRYNAITTGNDIQNRVWFAELNDKLNIIDMYELEVVGEKFKRGVEDARLFWRDGVWHMTAVILEREHTRIARVGYFRINTDTKQAIFLEKYEVPDSLAPEKNWGMVADGAVKEFDYIYGPNKIFKNGKIKALADAEEYKKIRGGSQLIPWGDGYLAVCHITRMIAKEALFNPTTFSMEKIALRSYTHVFVEYDKSGQIKKVSEEFLFNIPGVEFAAGLLQLRDKVYISYGREDSESWLASLDVKTVKEMLR